MKEIQLHNFRQKNKKNTFKKLVDLLLLFVFVSIACTDLNTIPIKEPIISIEDWREINVAIQDFNLEPEEFYIETNSFGNIISVDSNQEPIVLLLLNKLVLAEIDSKGKFVQFKSLITYGNNRLGGFKPNNLKEKGKKGKIYTVYKFAKKLYRSDYYVMKPHFTKKINDDYNSLIGVDSTLSFEDYINIRNYDFEKFITKIMDEEINMIYEDSNWKFNSKF